MSGETIKSELSHMATCVKIEELLQEARVGETLVLTVQRHHGGKLSVGAEMRTPGTRGRVIVRGGLYDDKFAPFATCVLRTLCKLVETRKLHDEVRE